MDTYYQALLDEFYPKIETPAKPEKKLSENPRTIYIRLAMRRHRAGLSKPRGWNKSPLTKSERCKLAMRRLRAKRKSLGT